MRTLSTRTLATLAYERGEDYDPALFLHDAGLLEQLTLGARAPPLIEAPSSYEGRRERARQRRQAHARIPDWFSAEDLVDDPLAVVHGEPV